MRSPKRWLSAACTLGLIGFTASAAMAQYPGSLVTLTASGTNVRDLFVVTNGGKTLEVTGEAAGSPTGTSDWFLDGVRLVGFRSIFLVDPVGPSPVANAPGSGFVRTDVGNLASQFNWTTKLNNGFTAHDDGAPGFGFSNGSRFMVVSNDAGLTGAGKSTTQNTDRFGSFTWTDSLVDGNGDFKSYIGLDYILANGNTGRGYFKYTSVVPEPAFYQLASLLGLGGVGMLRLRRRTKKG